MQLLSKMRQQKFLSLALLLVTLGIGIVIGTVVNTGVHAARTQAIAPDASPLQVPQVTQLGNEFTKLAKRLEPSVVYITGEFTPKAGVRGDDDEDQSESGPDLFHRFLEKDPQNLPPRAFRQEQSGTGFIVDRNGYIITNQHVVSKVDRIKVKLHGGDGDSEYRARVIGTDPETDIAVIKIDPRTPLVPVTIGNSDGLQVGDWTVAIGSPFELEASVTAGIVSALGRDIGTLQLQRFIQTDAAINPGNSGGPLLNIRGEVIGVNTMIATRSGGYQGIGFALPMNLVVRVYNDIIKNGRPVRGSIGVSWDPNNKPELMRALGVNHGVLVSEVKKGGPAEKAGIKVEDIILAMNGNAVKNGEDLVGRVSQTAVGTPVHLLVDRSGKKMDLTVEVEDRSDVWKERIAGLRQEDPDPQVTTRSIVPAKFGMRIRPLADADRKSLGIDSSGGVQVLTIESGSFAEDVGLMERDVILSINRHPVSSIEDVQREQAKLHAGDPVALRIMRQMPAGKQGSQSTRTFYLAGTWAE